MLEFTAIKRTAIVLLFVSLAAALRAAEAKRPAASSFTVVEATIPEMRAAMEQGRVTSRGLVLQSLARIAIYEDKLHAAITVNRDALKEADERDRERRLKKVRGPLHGIPVAVKDNIHTTDMPTTGGALAFDGFVRSEEHTSELQSQSNLVCRLLLEKKKKTSPQAPRRPRNLKQWVLSAP